jgi:large subunit ribosomal protein L21
MYAIIETGGKQYRVSAGQSIEVEQLHAGVGETVEINDVLLLADNGDVVVGAPTVEGAKVVATVLEQGRGRKVIVFKFRSGNRYHRKRGHRQAYTRLRVEDIVSGGAAVKGPVRPTVEEPEVAADEGIVEAERVSLDELELPSRVAKALTGAGVKTVRDLLSLEEEALLAIRGIGAKSLEQVREALEAKGFVQG